MERSVEGVSLWDGFSTVFASPRGDAHRKWADKTWSFSPFDPSLVHLTWVPCLLL